MAPQTISEKILSTKSGQVAQAGDIVVCDIDRILGTDASGPMSIAYFERMGGTAIRHPDRVAFALDHYSPPSSPRTQSFHDEVRAFGARYGVHVYDEGEGISHQIVSERGEVVPGELVIGADSHTVTCGALGLFATGVGSSDLAAAMITGKIWLRVPQTISVVVTGALPAAVFAKDIALEMVRVLGAEGANYRALEFTGDTIAALSIEERLVLSNLAVESGAKAAIVPADDVTARYLAERGRVGWEAVHSDVGARFEREIVIHVGGLSPRVSLPHMPDHVVELTAAVGTPVHMVFLGTCTGGRVSDFHQALAVLERGGNRIAPGVQLVVTPASREVQETLERDGTLARFVALGAVVTTAGCGACCGTSGVIPGEGMNVLSTANRNFKARMGRASASIYLASPAACAAAAVTGHITDPREMGT